MGWNVEWLAASGASVEELAAAVAHEIGDDLDFPQGSCIAELDEWVIVYGEGSALVAGIDLSEASTGRTVVNHRSYDTVMSAETSLWADGELQWSIGIDLGAADADALSATGIPPADEKKLRSQYNRSGPSAYDAIADRAQQVVGFRHDQSSDRWRFRALVDTRVKPTTTTDRTVHWLLENGFEAEDNDAPATANRHFRRPIDAEFAVIVTVSEERYQYYEDWCDLNVGVHHRGAAELWASQRSYIEYNPFIYVGRHTFVRYGPSQLSRVDPEPIPFDAFVKQLKSEIEDATTYCTYERLSSMCRPDFGLALEAAVGWSTRSESYLGQAQAFNRFSQSTNSSDSAVYISWVDEFRETPRLVPPPAAERALDELEAALADDQPVSGPELAALQNDRRAPTELCAALAYGHWLCAFDLGGMDAEIAVHVARHHLFAGDAERIARVVELPIEVQLEFAASDVPNLPFQLGFNPSLDPPVQVRLAQDGNWSVGTHPDLVREAQHILAEDPREYLPANPSLLPELHALISKSSTYQVREALARNPNLLPEVLAKLTRDRKGEVKRAAARNPSLPEEIQLQVLEKANKDALGGLQQNPALAPSVQHLIADKGDLHLIASTAPLVDELLQRAVKSPERMDRANVARNPGLHSDLHEVLSADDDEWVRSSLATNPSLDIDLLVRLQDDDDEGVRRVAKLNVNKRRQATSP